MGVIAYKIIKNETTMKASSLSLYIVSSFEFKAAALISLALRDALRSCFPLVRIY